MVIGSHISHSLHFKLPSSPQMVSEGNLYGSNGPKYGVYYIDLTGEFAWVKRMIHKYGKGAPLQR